MTKLLLDTDIGSDIDDAVALAYLLSHPDCELLGITTVTGQAEQRASLASLLCRAAGRDIPIYPGADLPMRGEQRQPIAQHATALLRWPHGASFPMNQAVEFLANTIRDSPGEITLLTIGPLTNIGMLFSTYPDVPELLAGFVMMGGTFGDAPTGQDRAEWNVACDPSAAELVYKAPVRLHRSVGLNVTRKVMMSVEEVRRRFRAPLLLPVLDMAEIWFAESHPSMTFHDPLAAATIFEPDLCTYRQGIVTVENTDTPGKTMFSQVQTYAPHQVAMNLDVDRYFEHFFRVVGE